VPRRFVSGRPRRDPFRRSPHESALAGPREESYGSGQAPLCRPGSQTARRRTGLPKPGIEMTIIVFEKTSPACAPALHQPPHRYLDKGFRPIGGSIATSASCTTRAATTFLNRAPAAGVTPSSPATKSTSGTPPPRTSHRELTIQHAHPARHWEKDTSEPVHHHGGRENLMVYTGLQPAPLAGFGIASAPISSSGNAG
jgi:hypothetical protein